VFSTTIHFYPSLIFAGKAESIRVKLFMRLHYHGKLQTLPTNIRQGWKVGIGEIAISEKMNWTEWDGTERDSVVGVLGLKIPLITAHEW
jgi:hypothetical protein